MTTSCHSAGQVPLGVGEALECVLAARDAVGAIRDLLGEEGHQVTQARPWSVNSSPESRPKVVDQLPGFLLGKPSLKYPPDHTQTVDFLAAHRHQSLRHQSPHESARCVSKGTFLLGGDI